MSEHIIIAITAAGFCGFAGGFIAAGIVSARKIERSAIESWKAARIYYTKRQNPDRA